MQSDNNDTEVEFLSWITPCIGKLGYGVLGIPSTDITLEAINTNIIFQQATTGLNKWLNKWVSK